MAPSFSTPNHVHTLWVSDDDSSLLEASSLLAAARLLALDAEWRPVEGSGGGVGKRLTRIAVLQAVSYGNHGGDLLLPLNILAL